MFLEIIRSKGLAHLSYILGHGGKATVIYPRRDCEVHVDIAYKSGAVITHIFETHRNKDYVIGSLELSHRTGAEIYHGKALDFHYGNPVSEGDVFQQGDLHGTPAVSRSTTGSTETESSARIAFAACSSARWMNPRFVLFGRSDCHE